MLKAKVSQYFRSMQPFLFPGFEKELGPTTEKHLQIIVAIDMLDVDALIPYSNCNEVGRPPMDRSAFARAFVAKSVLNLPTTKGLIDRLKVDSVLRRLCGFESLRLPCEATFSNVFAEFSESKLATKIHEQLIQKTYKDRIVGHVSRDSTAIEGREKPTKKQKKVKKKKSKKRGRPAKGEIREEREETRIKKQLSMSLDEMIADLPKDCDVGGKKNSQGNPEWWIGYKIHFDTDDNGVPLSAIITSASTHDSQVALPLEKATNNIVSSLYSLMDSAYNSEIIHKYVLDAGKVPIIDPKKPRGGEKIPLDPAKQERYKKRTTVERTNSTIKDDFGGRHVRVRGYAKVCAHLMFGIAAMSALRIVETFS